MEVNFLNQYLSMPSWPGVFQLATFLSVAQSESRFIFAFGPSSSHFNFFPCCLSIQLFCYILFVPIFCSKIVLLPYRFLIDGSLQFPGWTIWLWPLNFEFLSLSIWWGSPLTQLSSTLLHIHHAASHDFLWWVFSEFSLLFLLTSSLFPLSSFFSFFLIS